MLTAAKIKLIKSNNTDRNKKFLAKKYLALKENPFRFFRGTPELFYDFIQQKKINEAPVTELCGDLHLENFGVYKNENREVCYGMNDFDEACYGPFSYDLIRLLASIGVFTDMYSLGSKSEKLCAKFLQYYADALTKINLSDKKILKAREIKKLITTVTKRNRKDFIKQRTFKKGKEIKLKVDSKKYFPIDKSEFKQIKDSFEKSALYSINPKFYGVMDIAFRVAGTSSLGLNRYVALIHGKGYPNFYLLDIKQSCSVSIPIDMLHKKQPVFKDNSERILFFQGKIQKYTIAHLSDMKIGGKNYVVKELQPTSDKLNLDKNMASVKKLNTLLKALALITARAHSSEVEVRIKLAAFLNKKKEVDILIKHALEYVQINRAYYKDFSKKKGLLL